MSKSKGEHALAIFKAGISAVPYVGGSIATLIDEYAPDSTQRSINRATGLLTSKLNKLEDRIDGETVNKDEFVELFKSCYLLILRTHQEEKLNAVANLLTNILLIFILIKPLAHAGLALATAISAFLNAGLLFFCSAF